MDILALLREPWPWYVGGPLIGFTVPLLLLLGNKKLGVSANLRHACAVIPNKIDFFNYDWRKESWNLVFALGLLLGGFLGGVLLASPEPLQLSPSTARDLTALGVQPDGALVPEALFGWSSLLTIRGLLLMVGGGFLVGFGARYAGGCTSGHAIMGLSELQLPSLVAVVGFFVGGLLATHVLLPFILAL